MTALKVIALVLAGLALILAAHALIFLASAGFYGRRIKTRIFDNPLPWYVRYENWVGRGFDREARVKGTDPPVRRLPRFTWYALTWLVLFVSLSVVIQPLWGWRFYAALALVIALSFVPPDLSRTRR